ncbi:MAG: ubiquinone/menaquinone biosynthesis C-methylase UbiE [Candidatus Aldehydirespiratoraceae bacterium]|jgi:ubiquinone/menaquinone biosynthesis C-methylase UbiE
MTVHLDVLASHVALDGARVIDVGFGQGALMRELRSCGADVVGVEVNVASREAAIAADPDHAAAYLAGVGEALPFADSTADAVVFSYSLHHVPAAALDDALGEARRVLKTGGTLYSLEPIPKGPEHDLAALIDDETEVRAFAQDALDRVVGFEERHRSEYESDNLYDDWDAWEAVMVGVDSTRAAIMAEQRNRARQMFEATALRTVDGRRRFLEGNLLRVFTAS